MKDHSVRDDQLQRLPIVGQDGPSQTARATMTEGQHGRQFDRDEDPQKIAPTITD